MDTKIYIIREVSFIVLFMAFLCVSMCKTMCTNGKVGAHVCILPQMAEDIFQVPYAF